MKYSRRVANPSDDLMDSDSYNVNRSSRGQRIFTPDLF